MLVYLFLVFFNLNYVIPKGLMPPEKQDKSLQVNTINGIIQGSEEKTMHGKSYFSYVGIPYARPPVKNLRFRGPKPIPKWSGVLDATLPGPCCAGINMTIYPDFQIHVTGEEDCLYLNVYAPKKPNAENLKSPVPVMMYIYGGGFFGGCANEFGPDFLVENDVILVVPNHRLVVFGYLSTEDMECPGNWAIKDQLAALKWIQTNIQQFGGDPKRVTIFGQSAGAANINVLLLSPKAKGLFHGAILMSGSSLSFWAYQTDPKKVAFDVGISLGIKTNSTKVLIEELRKIDGKTLLQSQIPVLLVNLIAVLTNGLPFTSSIELPHKDAVLTNFPYDLLERGEFNRIPVMTGVTTMEALFAKAALDKVMPFISIFDMSPSILVRMTNDPENKLLVGNKIKGFFFPYGSFASAGKVDILKLLSEDAYWRPVSKMASLVAKYSPVYFYQFSYEGQLGLELNKYLSGITKRTIKGVAHSEDFRYLFATKGYGPSTKDMLLIRKLTKLYANFAKSGNPTPTTDPLLDNITWPRVTNNKFPYLIIEERLNIRNTNFNEVSFQFWEDIFKTYGQKPFKIY